MKVFDGTSLTFVCHNDEIAFKGTCHKSWCVGNRPVQVGKQKSILGSNLGQIKGLKFVFGCIVLVRYCQRRRLLCAKGTRELCDQGMGVGFLRKMGRTQRQSSERVQRARIPSSSQPFALVWTTKSSSLMWPGSLMTTTNLNKKGVVCSSRNNRIIIRRLRRTRRLIIRDHGTRRTMWWGKRNARSLRRWDRDWSLIGLKVMLPTCHDIVAPILARWVRVADTKLKMSWQFVSARADIFQIFRSAYVEIYYGMGVHTHRYSTLISVMFSCHGSAPSTNHQDHLLDRGITTTLLK